MHALRSARFLARLVLAWFVLAMGVAVAAPMVQPRGLDFVCAGGGLKLMQAEPEGQAAPSAVGLDCPLCSTVAAPPPAAMAFGLLAASHDSVPPAVASAPFAAALPAPPARGPPAPEST